MQEHHQKTEPSNHPDPNDNERLVRILREIARDRRGKSDFPWNLVEQKSIDKAADEIERLTGHMATFASGFRAAEWMIKFWKTSFFLSLTVLAGVLAGHCLPRIFRHFL